MAKIHRDQTLIPSVLDRLLDFDPGVSREPPPRRHQVLAELKQSVRRDLESLLNTRVRNLTWAGELGELEGSLIDYGLPDFTGTTLASAKDRDDFCRLMEEIIRRHEPRLVIVQVSPISDGEPLDRSFRFRIDALLQAEPAPEPVVFDSVVKPATGNFEVRGVS